MLFIQILLLYSFLQSHLKCLICFIVSLFQFYWCMGFQYCWRSWKHVALYRPPVACIHLTKALFSCWNTSMWFKWVVVCPSCSNTAGLSVHPPPASHQPDAIATPHKITFFTLERIGPFLAAVCARLCGDKGTPSYQPRFHFTKHISSLP